MSVISVVMGIEHNIEKENNNQNMKIDKRRALIIALAALFISSVQGQKISYGVIVGADITNMYLAPVHLSDQTGMYSPIASYNLNGFVSYKTNFFLGISVEPGIIRKGGVQLFDYLNSQYQPVTNQVIATITSIQIPILLDFHLTDRLYVSAGVELEYKISQKAVMTDKATTNHLFAGSVPLYAVRGTGTNTIGDNLLPEGDYTYKYYSGLAGLHYKINKRFDVGLRYGFSLKELYSILWEDENKVPMDYSNIYTSYWQLSLKVRL